MTPKRTVLSNGMVLLTSEQRTLQVELRAQSALPLSPRTKVQFAPSSQDTLPLWPVMSAQ